MPDVGPLRTVDQTIAALKKIRGAPIPAPRYTSNGKPERICLAIEAMKRHMADAGWQLQAGLEEAGYTLCGYNLSLDEINVPAILNKIDPGIVVVQDKREWECLTAGQWRSKHVGSTRFQDVDCLWDRNDIFKLTVLKDAHQSPGYHRASAVEIDCHAWIIYYHPRIVRRVAPYIRPKHCIRTYHSVDANSIPEYTDRERICIMSGAVSSAYPLRRQIINALGTDLRKVDRQKHPGYGHIRCVTPEYLNLLSEFRVAICTSSRYGYTLRKLIEATACGCRVITDLPTDEVMPEIDDNLFRVSSEIRPRSLAGIIDQLYAEYDPERQEKLAQRARDWYDYRAVGKRLAEEIEKMRTEYGS